MLYNGKCIHEHLNTSLLTRWGLILAMSSTGSSMGLGLEWGLELTRSSRGLGLELVLLLTRSSRGLGVGLG